MFWVWPAEKGQVRECGPELPRGYNGPQDILRSRRTAQTPASREKRLSQKQSPVGPFGLSSLWPETGRKGRRAEYTYQKGLCLSLARLSLHSLERGFEVHPFVLARVSSSLTSHFLDSGI